MALRVPTGLSPSKVEAFKSCPLAFRFSAIDKLPEAPSPATTRGTLVHRALELLYCRPAPERTLEAALADLATAADELADHPDVTGLGLDEEGMEAFVAGAATLVERYFLLEDPTAVRPIGIELQLEAEVGGIRLRGIIDRLELDEGGGLVVTDYKTGRTPHERNERGRLGGVHFYARLCEAVFGRRPSRVQLLYLAEPVAITAHPSDQSARFLDKQVAALWTAVERACRDDDFRPRPGRLCDFCGYRAFCPAMGGDLEAARAAALALEAEEAGPSSPGARPVPLAAVPG